MDFYPPPTDKLAKWSGLHRVVARVLLVVLSLQGVFVWVPVARAVGDGAVDSTVKIDDSTANGPVLSNTDVYGGSIASIGDVNGDGVADIAVGARLDDAGGTDRGAVHIHFLNTDGSVDSTVKIDDTTMNGPVLSDNDVYGVSLASIGDFNGDGVPDIAVGAHNDDTGGTDRGAVYIHFLNTDGSVDSTVKIDDTTANGPVLSDGDLYGTSVGSIGDLNGDGVTDIAVGARQDDAGGTNRGAVHIHFMNTDGSVDSTVEINDTTANGPVLADGDIYGANAGVISIGDLNRDGVTDIAVGAYDDDTGGTNRGAVHISFLNTDGSVDSTVKIDDATTNGPVLSDGDNYGTSIAPIGDFNGDGVEDLAVTSSLDDTGGPSRGAFYIHFMNTDGSIDSSVKIDDTTANGPMLADGDFYGIGITSIGDLNRDGISDIAVGARNDDTGGTNRGAVHIHFMNSIPRGTMAPGSTVEINDTTANGAVLADSDFYGAAVAPIGDLNDDGVEDLVVGAYADDAGGNLRGAIHIHFMNTDGSIDSTVEINDMTANGPVLSDGDTYGVSVASIGDLNDDGVEDLAVGATYDDAGGDNRGAIHIHFMNSDGSIDSTVEINDTTTNGPVLSDSDFYGFSVTSIGDLNHDGVEDIVVGAALDDAGSSNSGAVHISFMNTDGSVDSTVEINDNTTNGPVLSSGDFYGVSATSIGDLNDDGVDDLVIGAYSNDGGGSDRGAVHISFMNTNGTVDSTVEINDTTTNGPALSDSDFYAASVITLGDLNEDGVEDLVVGAYGDDSAGTDRGAVHVHFMNTDGSVDSTVEINDNTTNGPALSDGDYYGYSAVTSIGDLNDDGVADLIVGAPLDDAGGTNRGAIHIHFMREFTAEPTLSNAVTTSRLKAGSSSTYNFSFTLQNAITGTLTITFPVGFTVTGALTSGTCAGGTVGTFGFTSSTLTAVKTGCTAGILTVSGSTVTNPVAPGGYYISWVNDDPGGSMVYIIDADQVTVTANVDATITMNVGAQASATACDGTFSGNGGTVALGVLTSGAVTSSDASSISHICTRLSTNASSGAIMTVKSLNGVDGLKSTSVPTDKIPSPGGSSTIVAGTAGYALCAGSAGGDSGNDAISGSASPVRASPFNGASCTSTGHNVGGLTTSAQNLWTLATGAQNAFVRVYVKAAISPVTSAHSDYTDTLTFIGTGTF